MPAVHVYDLKVQPVLNASLNEADLSVDMEIRGAGTARLTLEGCADYSKILPEDRWELELPVLFTEEVGGILDMEFDEEGNLLFKSSADEGDLLYDEIACGMLVKKYQYEKRELLESLEMFFKVFFLGME